MKPIHKIVIFVVALFFLEYIFLSFGFKDVFRKVYSFLDDERRVIFIWILCTVICSFHYVFAIVMKNGVSKFFIKTSNDFLDLVSAFTTYSVVVNSSLTLVSGIIKEFIGDRKLFITATTLDFYTILGSSIFPIIWAFAQLYSIFLEGLKNSSHVEIPQASNNNDS